MFTVFFTAHLTQAISGCTEHLAIVPVWYVLDEPYAGDISDHFNPPQPQGNCSP